MQLNLCGILAMCPGILLLFYGGDIFRIVFGAEWQQAGHFAGVMILAEIIGMPTNSTTNFDVYRLNHWQTMWEVLRLMLVAGSLAISWALALPPFACIIAITASHAMSYVVLALLNVVAIQRLLRTFASPALTIQP